MYVGIYNECVLYYNTNRSVYINQYRKVKKNAKSQNNIYILLHF